MYPRVPLDRSPLHFTQLSGWVCCRRLDPWQRRRPRCSLLKPPFVPKFNPFSSLRSVFPPLYSMRGVAAWQGGGERGLLGSTFLIKLPPSSPQHLPRHLNASPLSRCCCCCRASLCPKKDLFWAPPAAHGIWSRGREKRAYSIPSTLYQNLSSPSSSPKSGWLDEGRRKWKWRGRKEEGGPPPSHFT